MLRHARVSIRTPSGASIPGTFFRQMASWRLRQFLERQIALAQLFPRIKQAAFRPQQSDIEPQFLQASDLVAADTVNPKERFGGIIAEPCLKNGSLQKQVIA